MAATRTSGLGYVSVLMLVVIFCVIVVAFLKDNHDKKTAEKFSDEKYALIPKDKIVVYQGSSLPDSKPKGIVFDDDKSLPTIDGKPDSSKSMFMMAFNKCDPSCCPSTYSCSGGCVCMTKDQMNFVGSRGNNSSSCSAL